jgi:FkbM family methyltransferase
MSFISYAQNREDVMLFRALKDVGKGFYIDVGAQDPVQDSVTKAFYERGWRGINIEPVEHWLERLAADRPEDINLQVAISDEPGMARLFEVKDTGLSTFSARTAEKHQESGLTSQEISVPVLTLESVLKSYSVDEIHFLKVDVEGSERGVLASIDLEKRRPWIVLVEATEPRSPVQNHGEWEHLLTERGYDFVYFDGLNRFYVARERQHLSSAFQAPPNVFDEFILNQEKKTQDQLGRLQAELADSRQHVDRLAMALTHSKQQADRLANELADSKQQADRQAAELARQAAELADSQRAAGHLQHELRLVYSSHSWHLSHPVRVLGQTKIGRAAIPWLTFGPGGVLRALRELLGRKVEARENADTAVPAPEPPASPSPAALLSASALRIYLDLKETLAAGDHE